MESLVLTKEIRTGPCIESCKAPCSGLPIENSLSLLEIRKGGAASASRHARHSEEGAGGGVQLVARERALVDPAEALLRPGTARHARLQPTLAESAANLAAGCIRRVTGDAARERLRAGLAAKRVLDAQQLILSAASAIFRAVRIEETAVAATAEAEDKLVEFHVNGSHL